jgi:trafficking protein particle complex subunit 8
MAQRRKSEIEFIQDTFSPIVTVSCSYDAEIICRKNNLTFVELVQPFCRLNGESKIFDPTNILFNISNLRIEVKDINTQTPAQLIANRLLNEAVTQQVSTHNNGLNEKQILLNDYKFKAYLNTPWYESWRDCFLRIGCPSDHEYLKHYLACVCFILFINPFLLS